MRSYKSDLACPCKPVYSTTCLPPPPGRNWSTKDREQMRAVLLCWTCLTSGLTSGGHADAGTSGARGAGSWARSWVGQMVDKWSIGSKVIKRLTRGRTVDRYSNG